MTKGQTNYHDRIVTDPEILAGKPTIKGTRIPVDLVLKRLSQDLNLDTLFESYPRLTDDDVKACFAYAREVLEHERETQSAHAGSSPTV